MPKHTVHFLNVKEGDCSIIEHGSGHVSVIDVCNARKLPAPVSVLEAARLQEKAAALGNFQQKKHPVNPIEYLLQFGIHSVFRFCLTHPDMDHMDGIEDLFDLFTPVNFYDTENNAEKEFPAGSPYREEDWLFYKQLRDSDPDKNPKRQILYSGDYRAHRRVDWSGDPPGDGWYTLAPTPELVVQANKTGNFNDASYVVMYWASAGKVIFGGDSHDATWDHILRTHEDLVTDIDLLIAPHHGRKSGRSYEFLDVLRPKMTFFGNANHEHLAYGAWRRRGLPYMTNNQGNTMVVDTREPTMSMYVTHESFARAINSVTTYSAEFRGWYVGEITAS